MKKSVSIVWWNTGLNPPRGRTKVKDFRAVYWTIVSLCKRADILFLGEFIPSKHKEIWKLLANSRSRAKMVLAQSSACAERHIALLHRKGYHVNSALALRDCGLDESSLGRCVAIRALIRDIPVVGEVAFYAIHWPSLIYDGNMFVKESAARTIIQDMESSNWHKAVCIGDFNAEPYQRPFVWLRSSRSRKFTHEDGVFYNPFWRFLHEDNGTIYYKNKCELNCLRPLIDQALISRKLSMAVDEIKAEVLSVSYQPQRCEHVPIHLQLRKRG